MLQRRSSYSSVPTDSDQPRRSPSSSSLSSRRFRKNPSRPAAPTPRTSARRTNAREWSSSSSENDADADTDADYHYHYDFSKPVSARNARPFPTTMRGVQSPTPLPRKPLAGPTGARERHHRADTDTDTDAVAGHQQQQHADHHHDSASSELESIAEDTAIMQIPTQIPEEADADDSSSSSEGPEDTFEFTRTGVGGQIEARAHATRDLLLLPTKHTPPPRSVSPAKSALRHVAHSEAGSARRARVSFSDEDSIASFSAYAWPAMVGMSDTPRATLPVFASLGRGGGAVASSSAASDSSEDVEMRVPGVPEVVLTVPQPQPPNEVPPRRGSVVNGGAGGDVGSDSDSLSGDSIYEDAYEDIPAAPVSAPVVLNALAIITTSAPSPDQHADLEPHLLLDPSLPPDFLARPQLNQPHPSPSSSTASSFSPPLSPSLSSDTASIHSESSFRRLSPRPRRRRPGMLQSLRTAPPSHDPAVTKPPDSRPPFAHDGGDGGLSPSDVGTKLQRKRTGSWSGSTGRKQGGFWRVFSKREFLAAADGRGVITKKPVRGGKDVWTGGSVEAGGVTTVIAGGPEAVGLELGLGEEKEQDKEVEGGKEVVKKKKFGRLKKLLRLS